ncbi:FixH family protein [Halomonas sp. Bachu 37]|uniref:FixH family protein n=1 Tax=Halomonas kashgarensis TaxID=3084920 RepID=UPI003217C51A
MAPTTSDVPPWYKQFWPWFLIGLLFSSIAFSTLYLVMSIKFYDGSVQQDYYKDGLAINEQLAKQEHAQTLSLAASLLVDSRTGDIVVDLEGERRPDQLHLSLIFPTAGGRDRSLVLDHLHGGRYVTVIDEPLRHRWYLQLQPSAGRDAEWRLTGEATFPSEETIDLTPGL